MARRCLPSLLRTAPTRRPSSTTAASFRASSCPTGTAIPWTSSSATTILPAMRTTAGTWVRSSADSATASAKAGSPSTARPISCTATTAATTCTAARSASTKRSGRTRSSATNCASPSSRPTARRTIPAHSPCMWRTSSSAASSRFSIMQSRTKRRRSTSPTTPIST